MAKRKSINKGLRFDVFNRDDFTCQYCWRSAPEVKLQADHIVAVKNWWLNEIQNLITSCSCCNIGKSAKKLWDVNEIKMQSKGIEDIVKKKETLKKYYDILKEENNDPFYEIKIIRDVFTKATWWKEIDWSEFIKIRKICKEYSIEKYIDAMMIQLERLPNQFCWWYIKRILINQKQAERNPIRAEKNKIKNTISKIIRNYWYETKRPLHRFSKNIETLNLMLSSGFINKAIVWYKEYENKLSFEKYITMQIKWFCISQDNY